MLSMTEECILDAYMDALNNLIVDFIHAAQKRNIELYDGKTNASLFFLELRDLHRNLRFVKSYDEFANWREEVERYGLAAKRFEMYGLVYPVKDGWHQLLDTYISKIKEIDSSCEILDIREKYGSCIVTVVASDSSKQHEIDSLVEQLEKESEHICEFCGAPGTIKEYKNNWIKCLCEDCSKTI